MKKGLVILAILMLIKPLLPILEYGLNYDYISKVLCINKEKPDLKCNGKCHLMKELAKASEDEKPISDKKISVKEIEILFFEEIKQVSFVKALTVQQSVFNSNYCNLYHYLKSATAFHPPTSIS